MKNNLDGLDRKLVMLNFRRFLAATTGLADKSNVSSFQQKRRLIFYMYGVLNGLQQQVSFMRDEPETEKQVMELLVFKVSILSTIYIHSMIDGVIEIKYTSEEISKIFFDITGYGHNFKSDENFGHVNLQILIKGENAASAFIRISEAKDIERISSSLFHLLMVKEKDLPAMLIKGIRSK